MSIDAIRARWAGAGAMDALQLATIVPTDIATLLAALDELEQRNARLVQHCAEAMCAYGKVSQREHDCKAANDSLTAERDKWRAAAEEPDPRTGRRVMHQLLRAEIAGLTAERDAALKAQSARFWEQHAELGRCHDSLQADCEQLRELAVNAMKLHGMEARRYVAAVAERDAAQASVRELEAALRDVARVSAGHHSDQAAHLWLHALTVDIPSLAETALNLTAKE